MRRLMLCLICLVCASFAPRALAQDYGEWAKEVVHQYTSGTHFEELAPGFWEVSNRCSETPATTFEVLPLVDDPSIRELPVGMLQRIGTDQGVYYVLFAELLEIDSIGVHGIVCEDSPVGETLRELVSDQFYCWQDIPPSIRIAGLWTNQDGNRALVRFRVPLWSLNVFVYLKKEKDTWTYEKHMCNGPEAQALSLVTEYMYDFNDPTLYSDPNFSRPFYYLGSPDRPMFADVTSVRQGNNTGQATVLIQLETLDEDKSIQDDPLCMLNLRNDIWWIVYEVRCTSD